jgi:hypothetical protein
MKNPETQTAAARIAWLPVLDPLHHVAFVFLVALNVVVSLFSGISIYFPA